MAFLPGFKRRQKITIDSDTYISGDLTDQTIVVHIPSTNTDFWASDNSDGTYVRFTASDGETLLKFEVESFDDTGEDAWWHIKVSTLLSSTDTEIYVYYDAATPSDGSDRENTWDANYQAVWHLNVDKSEGELDDSTSNDNDLTNTGTTDRIGQIDKGRNFDGIDDYMQADPTLGGDWSTNFTIEGIIDADTLPANFDVLFGNNSADVLTFLRIQSNGNKKPAFWVFDETGDAWRNVEALATINTSTKYHLVGICTVGGSVELFINSVSQGTDGVVDSIRTNGSDGVTIGAIYTEVDFFDGLIDEVTVSVGVARSPDWIKARYQSSLGTWLSFGVEEVRVAGFPFFFGVEDRFVI